MSETVLMDRQPEVVRGESAAVRRGLDADSPEQFLWEGQLHRVRAVLGHHSGGRVERWQVQAAAGRHAVPEVFALNLDWSAGRWEVIPVSEVTRVEVRG
jgi:hypothetical protein